MSFKDFSVIGDHSAGYENLYNAAVEVLKNPDDRLVVEVGTREGGSLMTLMTAITDTYKDRPIISIDPYGGKPYLSRDNVIDGMYPDDLYMNMLSYVTAHVIQNKVYWSHYKHTSLDWIKFWDKTDFWVNGKIAKPEFAFVHLDGDHNTDTVRQELAYFVPRTKGWVVVDDADQISLTDGGIAKYKGEVRDNYLWIKCE